jgi:hypothetical protein
MEWIPISNRETDVVSASYAESHVLSANGRIALKVMLGLLDARNPVSFLAVETHVQNPEQK